STDTPSCSNTVSSAAASVAISTTYDQPEQPLRFTPKRKPTAPGVSARYWRTRASAAGGRVMAMASIISPLPASRRQRLNLSFTSGHPAGKSRHGSAQRPRGARGFGRRGQRSHRPRLGADTARLQGGPELRQRQRRLLLRGDPGGGAGHARQLRERSEAPEHRL